MKSIKTLGIKEPTLIFYGFYLRNSLSNLCRDYEKVANALRIKRKQLQETFLLKDRKEGDYEIVSKSKKSVVMVHFFHDVFILFLARNSDSHESWCDLYRKCSLGKINGMFGSTYIFEAETGRSTISTESELPEDIIKEIKKIFKHKNVPYWSRPRSASLNGGLLFQLAEHIYIFITKNRDVAQKFLISDFPRFELYRQKSEYQHYRYKKSCDQLKKALLSAQRVKMLHRAAQSSQKRRTTVYEQALKANIVFQRSINELQQMKSNIDANVSNIHFEVQECIKPKSGILFDELYHKANTIGEKACEILQRILADDLHQQELVENLKNIGVDPYRADRILGNYFSKYPPEAMATYDHFVTVKKNWNIWHFFKIPEMIRHDQVHSEGVYRICVDFLAKIPTLKNLTAMDVYALVCAAYLHDVGLQGGILLDDAGISVPLTDFKHVRKLHGLLSCEIVTSSNFYTMLNLKREIADVIGYISKYHQRATPIGNSSKYVYEMFDDNGRKHTFTIEPIKTEIVTNSHRFQTSALAALLRLADALDVNALRAGEPDYLWSWSHNLMLYLKKEAKRLEKRLPQHIMKSILLLSDVNDYNIPPIRKHLKGKNNKEFEYLLHLLKQPEHYEKHNHFISCKIAFSRGKLQITYAPSPGKKLNVQLLKLIKRDVDGEFRPVKKILNKFGIRKLEVMGTNG